MAAEKRGPRTLEEAEDAPDRKVLTDIRDHGWHVVKVMGEGNSGYGSAFTIGLPTTFGHPELLIVGLRLHTMHVILNNLGEDLRVGRRFEAGQESDDILEGYRCCFRAVPKRWYGEYLGWATWYHRGTGFDTLQVVYPDKEGRFPWHPGASDAFRRQQPVLDAPLARA